MNNEYIKYQQKMDTDQDFLKKQQKGLSWKKNWLDKRTNKEVKNVSTDDKRQN